MVRLPEKDHRIVDIKITVSGDSTAEGSGGMR